MQQAVLMQQEREAQHLLQTRYVGVIMAATQRKACKQHCLVPALRALAFHHPLRLAHALQRHQAATRGVCGGRPRRSSGGARGCTCREGAPAAAGV